MKRRSLYACFVVLILSQFFLMLRLSLESCVPKQTDENALFSVGVSFHRNYTSGASITAYVSFDNIDSPGNDIAYIPSPSISDLKQVCSALDRCVGFSSLGWVKAKTDSRVVMNGTQLFVKLQPSSAGSHLGSAAAGIYAPVLPLVSDMSQNIKIFVYTTSVGQHMPSRDDYKYGVERLFIDLLLSSPYITKQAHEAQFFFLPLRCSAYRKFVPDLQEGVMVARRVAMEMISEVRERYPYWNRSLGADHFYVCAHDMGAGLLQEQALWKNVIALVNTADSSSPYFVPHKDISLPNHPGRGVVPWSDLGAHIISGHAHRPTLLFFAGNPTRGLRPELFKLFMGAPRVKLVAGYMSEQKYLKELQTSLFCLCPRGNEVWSPRIMEALWLGCVPVVIADHYVLPLNELIQWNRTTVLVPERQLSNTMDRLLAITPQQWTDYRDYGRKVVRHLTWNSPPKPYDAFHSVLFQLWKRRH